MSFSVVTNLSSLSAQSALSRSQASMAKSLERLTSGKRINSSADDAAGLAVANRHRLDSTSLSGGAENAREAIDQLQIQDGALNNISSLVSRATTLASRAVSDTFTGDRSALNEEFQSVIAEISRSAAAAGLETGSTKLSNQDVFAENTQTNTSNSASYTSAPATNAADAQGLGLNADNITSQDGAAAPISSLQAAMGTLGAVQGRTGSAMNQLSFAVARARSTAASVQASESRIRDANMAREAAGLVKSKLLIESTGSHGVRQRLGQVCSEASGIARQHVCTGEHGIGCSEEERGKPGQPLPHESCRPPFNRHDCPPVNSTKGRVNRVPPIDLRPLPSL